MLRSPFLVTSLVFSALVASCFSAATYAENRLTGLHDVRFVSDNVANQDYLITLPICVERDNGDDYEIRISSPFTKGKDYRLAASTDTSEQIKVEYRFNDHPSNQGKKLETGKAFEGDDGSTSAYCAGSGPNANLTVKINDKELEKVFADIYSAAITIELYDQSGSTLLTSQMISIELIRTADFLINTVGDIFLSNTTDKQEFEIFCIGLVPVDKKNDQDYRVSVTGRYPTNNGQHWQLRNSVGDLVPYELKWVEKSKPKGANLSPVNTTAVYKIKTKDAQNNYSSLRRFGTCPETEEGFEFKLIQLASNSGVYNDTLTVTVSAE